MTPQSQTGGIPVLLETILFLTLKIKQNKFTKSVDRCEFDDLKNIYFLFLGGLRKLLGGVQPPPKIGLDTPLVTHHAILKISVSVHIPNHVTNQMPAIT